MLGAGQLARMMAIAGGSLNLQLLAFDINTEQVIHPLSGMVSDKTIDEAIHWSDVITAEFEHVPHNILEHCESSGKLLPSAQNIKIGGDRRLEKKALDFAKLKNAPYCEINCREDIDKAIKQLGGLPLVFKSALGGYDGKGQWILKNQESINNLWLELDYFLHTTVHQGIIAEQYVPFNREVSIIGVRDAHGHTQMYPIAENKHTGGILRSSVVLAHSSLQAQAQQIFTQLSSTLNYVGVLAIELFDIDGELVVNEIAPRVHNSGHWTIEGAETDQFENHLRAVCGIPLGSTRIIRPTATINLLGIDYLPERIYSMPGYHVHWYGKDKRSGRKMGHINICSNSSETLFDTVNACKATFKLSDQ